MKAWHFVGDTLRDGRPIPADGEWLEHEGEAIMCVRGLHASRCVLDALRYAPGNTLSRVVLGGDIQKGDDKVVVTRRKILWRIDAEALLFEAARLYALEVADLWDAPKVVLNFLKTGDESLRSAARDAAWNAARAAWNAAWAARAAAGNAAWAAAGNAAWDAAGNAAGAARNAAGAAAGDAAQAKQRTILRNLIARQLREER